MDNTGFSARKLARKRERKKSKRQKIVEILSRTRHLSTRAVGEYRKRFSCDEEE